MVSKGARPEIVSRRKMARSSLMADLGLGLGGNWVERRDKAVWRLVAGRDRVKKESTKKEGAQAKSANCQV